MALLRRPLFLLLLIVTHQFLQFWIAFGSVNEEGQKQEEFYEELLLKPLPDRKLLTHFHFQSSAPPCTSNGRHHHLFPKAISQLVLSVLLFILYFFWVTRKSCGLENIKYFGIYDFSCCFFFNGVGGVSLT